MLLFSRSSICRTSFVCSRPLTHKRHCWPISLASPARLLLKPKRNIWLSLTALIMSRPIRSFSWLSYSKFFLVWVKSWSKVGLKMSSIRSRLTSSVCFGRWEQLVVLFGMMCVGCSADRCYRGAIFFCAAAKMSTLCIFFNIIGPKSLPHKK